MGDTPSPPDPMTTANTQANMNKQTAVTQQNLNMVDQKTPYGSLNYNQTGTWADGTPKYGADISLNPQGQGLLDQYNTTKLAQGGLAQKLLSSNTGALSGQPLDLSYGATEAKLNQLNKNTLDPQWNAATNQEEQKLYDRGVRPGTEAYDNEMRVFNSSKNNAYDQMYLQGHNTAVNDITQEYNSPLQTYSTLMTGTQPQNPTFQTTPQTGVSPVNYAGLVQQNYNDQVQQNSAQMGGLFGLAGTLGGAALKYSNPLTAMMPVPASPTGAW